jgi:hypothetical protein
MTDTKTILDEIKRVLAETGPPPPELHFSQHVPSMGDPLGRPVSDDMRAMVGDLQDRGETKQIAIAYYIDGVGYVLNSSYRGALTNG